MHSLCRSGLDARRLEAVARGDASALEDVLYELLEDGDVLEVVGEPVALPAPARRLLVAREFAEPGGALPVVVACADGSVLAGSARPEGGVQLPRRLSLARHDPNRRELQQVLAVRQPYSHAFVVLIVTLDADDLSQLDLYRCTYRAAGRSVHFAPALDGQGMMGVVRAIEPRLPLPALWARSVVDSRTARQSGADLQALLRRHRAALPRSTRLGRPVALASSVAGDVAVGWSDGRVTRETGGVGGVEVALDLGERLRSVDILAASGGAGPSRSPGSLVVCTDDGVVHLLSGGEQTATYAGVQPISAWAQEGLVVLCSGSSMVLGAPRRAAPLRRQALLALDEALGGRWGQWIDGERDSARAIARLVCWIEAAEESVVWPVGLRERVNQVAAHGESVLLGIRLAAWLRSSPRSELAHAVAADARRAGAPAFRHSVASALDGAAPAAGSRSQPPAQLRRLALGGGGYLDGEEVRQLVPLVGRSGGWLLVRAGQRALAVAAPPRDAEATWSAAVHPVVVAGGGRPRRMLSAGPGRVVIEVDSADGPVLAVIEHEPWVEASPITLHGEFVAAVSLGEEIGVVFRRGARNYLQVLRSGMSGWHLDERTIHLPGADLSSVDAVVRN